MNWGDHDKLADVGIRRFACFCTRRSIDPQPRRVGDVAFRGPVDSWIIVTHCRRAGLPACIWRHMVWVYAENGATWERCGGIRTQRDADEYKSMHPNGPTDEEIRKANGA